MYGYTVLILILQNFLFLTIITLFSKVAEWITIHNEILFLFLLFVSRHRHKDNEKHVVQSRNNIAGGYKSSTVKHIQNYQKQCCITK